VTLESTVRLLENSLCGSCDAVVLEAGAAVFDLAIAKYSSSAEHGKWLLHLWSGERNIVRRVQEGEIKKGVAPPCAALEAGPAFETGNLPRALHTVCQANFHSLLRKILYSCGVSISFRHYMEVSCRIGSR
jgi:hypothetical protein